jgi:hypothetical protein
MRIVVIEKLLADEHHKAYALWALAFVGVCILVGLEKVKPETLEYVLFALLGFAASRRPMKGDKPDASAD